MLNRSGFETTAVQFREALRERADREMQERAEMAWGRVIIAMTWATAGMSRRYNIVYPVSLKWRREARVAASCNSCNACGSIL